MDYLKILPKIEDMRWIYLNTNKTPEELYANFKDMPYSAILCGKGKKDISRYAFIGINPFYVKKCTNLKQEPFKIFQSLINHFNVDKFDYPRNLWGAIGYFSYDACHFLEKVPHTTTNDLRMPYMEIVFYKDMIIYDFLKKKIFLIQVKFQKEPYTDLQIFLDLINKSKKFRKSATSSIDIDKKFLKCCSKNFYVKKVKKIIDYIIAGDVYEVNLSHRCSIKFEGEPYYIFRKLYELNPAPFSAYLPFGDYKIISSSPERFLLAEGKNIETRPIKGTAPRSNNKFEDLKIKKSLLASKKDDAELSMIVDLLRNDLGKVSEYGSVKVKKHKRIEKYENVWHLVSIIKSKLRKNEDYASLLRAVFPGGSITGCPKIRSMEIIDELEDYTRNIYTGTIFIANNRRLDASIVIRTAILYKNSLYFNVGGAVTYDSNPEKEYKETIDKAQSIIKALNLKF
jgi:para-aminobenzoate synthetase component 1